MNVSPSHSSSKKSTSEADPTPLDSDYNSAEELVPFDEEFHVGVRKSANNLFKNKNNSSTRSDESGSLS